MKPLVAPGPELTPAQQRHLLGLDYNRTENLPEREEGGSPGCGRIAREGSDGAG